MVLSMSLLANSLQEYNPICSIEDDRIQIRSERFLSSRDTILSSHYVYVGQARHFFSDTKYENASILVNGKSHIICLDCDYEELLNSVLSIFDHFDTWEEKLADAASHQATLLEMAEICAPIVRSPFFVCDMNGNVFVTSNIDKHPVDKHWERLFKHNSFSLDTVTTKSEIGGKRSSHDLSKAPQLVVPDDPDSQPFICMYLEIDNEPIGIFGIYQANSDLLSVNSHLSMVMARYLPRAAEFSSPSARIRSSFALLADIIEGVQVNENAISYFYKRNISAPWRLVLVSHEPKAAEDLLKSVLYRTLQGLKECCIPFMYNSDVLFLLRTDDETHYQRVVSEIDLSIFSLGLSMEFSDISSLPLRYKQSLFAIEISDGNGGVYSCEDFAFDYLIDNLSKQDLVTELIHPAIDTLIHYDEDNQGELCRTLFEFLSHDKSLKDAAAALNVHNNTLKYRLKRIIEITGIDLTDYEDFSYLSLSYWLTVHKCKTLE